MWWFIIRHLYSHTACMMDLTLFKGLMNTGLGNNRGHVLLCKMSFLKMGAFFYSANNCNEVGYD